jgi:hypothetical protein
MNKMLMLSLTAISIVIITSACTPGATVPASDGDNSIGTIKLVSNAVLHNQNTVIEMDDLFQNDSLRLFDGGEGLLDFGSDLSLRLFNDTEVGGVRTANDPGSPPNVKMILFAGGFIGKMFREGSKAVFETPNDAQIHIFATTFIVAYDQTTQETLIVNFEGDARVESAGSQLIPVRPGEIYIVRAGEQPVFLDTVPWTPGQYEEQARGFQSPLTPFDSIIVETGGEATEPPVDPPTATNTSTIEFTGTPIPEPSDTDTPPPPSRTPTPTKTQVLCPPMITVVKNAFCREGPSQVYREIDSFVVGEILQVEGRNSDETWWWVKKHTRGNCWISDVTVALRGDSSCLPNIKPPPTYTPTPTKPPTSTPTLCPGIHLGTPCP